MLKINSQKKWVDWHEAQVRLELSPLTVSLRQRLIDEATEPEFNSRGKATGRKKLNATRYQALVAEHCIHAWEGVVNADGQAMPCTPEARAAFMEIEPANIFVFTQVSGLGLHLEKEADAAGNASGG